MPSRQVFNQIHVNLARRFDVRYALYIGPNREYTMPTWMTAKQISARLTVGEDRLLEYAKRGNLAMYRMDDGSILFDAEGAARYFRSRIAAASRVPEMQNMGVLGSSRLADRRGQREQPSIGRREERRRELRHATTNSTVSHRVAKTG
jgi:hypothetical protein